MPPAPVVKRGWKKFFGAGAAEPNLKSDLTLGAGNFVSESLHLAFDEKELPTATTTWTRNNKYTTNT
jgi:hypothetical protein